MNTKNSQEYFEEVRILREYARDILGMTKIQARHYAATNAKEVPTQFSEPTMAELLQARDEVSSDQPI